MASLMKSELKKGYYLYGNKGAVWSDKIHIAKVGAGHTTLCGIPMLAFNHAEYIYADHAGCPECIDLHNKESISVDFSSLKVECPNGQIVLAPALLMLKASLAIEIRTGMRRHGESAYTQTKRLFCISGNKKSVFDQLVAILKENGLLPKEDKKVV